MGHTYLARCKKCGYEFEVQEGGGFFFHLLRCDECGKTKSISFDEIGEPLQENYPSDSISEEKYHSEVEKIAGKCKCAGQFKFNAPPKCPNCKSLVLINTGKIIMFYD